MSQQDQAPLLHEHEQYEARIETLENQVYRLQDEVNGLRSELYVLEGTVRDVTNLVYDLERNR